MFNEVFYFETTRKLVIAFGNLFNDIIILRKRSDQSEYERFTVPLVYAQKEKYYNRIKSDPDLQKRVEIVLPRLAFDITGFNYDGDRHLNSLIKNRNIGTNTEKKRQFSPVPYNLEFGLYVYTRYQDEGYQILEQILPWFTPHFTLAINSIPDLDLQDDLPIILNSISTEDNYDGEFGTERMIIHTLKFTAKAYYYGPIHTDKIIKKTQTDFLIPPGVGEITDAETAVTPRVARITETVNPSTANESDPHTIDETSEEFADGKKYDPVGDTDIDI